jgi:hypothetical protein
MRIALINPAWEYAELDAPECREHHPLLEFLYAAEMLRLRGVPCRILDAGAHEYGSEGLLAELSGFEPTDIFFSTAPGSIARHQAPSDLGVPAALCRDIRLAGLQANLICVGPHASAAPEATLYSLLCDAAIVGEPEAVIGAYTGRPRGEHFAYFSDGRLVLPRQAAEAAFERLPVPLRLGYPLGHHHHQLPSPLPGPATDVEFSRGCPHPSLISGAPGAPQGYRERPVEAVLAELAWLRSQGVAYVYFVDEVFGLGRSSLLLRLMAASTCCPAFGARTWLSLWDEPAIDLLAAAGCRSIEFVIEAGMPPFSIGTREAQRAEGLLQHATACLPWVQLRLRGLPQALAPSEDLAWLRGSLGSLCRLIEEPPARQKAVLGRRTGLPGEGPQPEAAVEQALGQAP